MSNCREKLAPRNDPARRCLKLRDWPEPDRLAWEAAIAQGSLLDEGGLASRWRESTRKTVQDAYGRWLTFLERNGWVETNDASPGERLTPDRLRAFVAELQETVAPNTLRNRITNLAEALRVMAPEFDFPYLRRARACLKARARPVRNKRAQMAPSRELLQLGLDLTQRAEREDGADELVRAALYRDGLMIMMLTCRPIRRRNFAELRLGLHLVQRGEAYVIVLEGSETKNHRRFEQALPTALTPLIERYLKQYRPQLLGRAQLDHVWISRKGRPMPDTGIYHAVRKRTKIAFGTGIPPHRFRDCAVTSMGEKDPELVWLAPALLHHADRRVAEIHYNQARDAGAVDLWQGYVLAERRAAKNKTHRRTRGRARPTRAYV
jgi:integrase/recombinase XerD